MGFWDSVLIAYLSMGISGLLLYWRELFYFLDENREEMKKLKAKEGEAAVKRAMRWEMVIMVIKMLIGWPIFFVSQLLIGIGQLLGFLSGLFDTFLNWWKS